MLCEVFVVYKNMMKIFMHAFQNSTSDIDVMGQNVEKYKMEDNEWNGTFMIKTIRGSCKFNFTYFVASIPWNVVSNHINKILQSYFCTHFFRSHGIIPCFIEIFPYRYALYVWILEAHPSQWWKSWWQNIYIVILWVNMWGVYIASILCKRFFCCWPKAFVCA